MRSQACVASEYARASDHPSTKSFTQSLRFTRAVDGTNIVPPRLPVNFIIQHCSLTSPTSLSQSFPDPVTGADRRTGIVHVQTFDQFDLLLRHRVTFPFSALSIRPIAVSS